MNLFRETDRYKIYGYDLNMKEDDTITIKYCVKAPGGSYNALYKNQITIPNSKDLTEEKIDSIITNAIELSIDDCTLSPGNFVNKLSRTDCTNYIAQFILACGHLIHEFLVSDTIIYTPLKFKILEAARDFRYIYDTNNEGRYYDIITMFRKAHDHQVKIKIIETFHDCNTILYELAKNDYIIEEKDTRVLATLAKYVPKFAYETKTGNILDDLILMYEENEDLFDIDILVNHILYFGIEEHDFSYLIDLCFELPAKYDPYKLVAALCIKSARAIEIFSDCTVDLYSAIAIAIAKEKYPTLELVGTSNPIFNITDLKKDKSKDNFSFYLDLQYHESTPEEEISKDGKTLTIAALNITSGYYIITLIDKTFKRYIDVYTNTVSAYSKSMISILNDAREIFIQDIGGQEVLDNAYKIEEEHKNTPIEIDLT